MPSNSGRSTIADDRCPPPPPLAVEHPFPTLLDPNWPHTELPHTALKLPDPFLAAHDHRSTASAVHLRRRPPALVAPPWQAAPNPIPSVYRCAQKWWCSHVPPPSPPAIAVAGIGQSTPRLPLWPRPRASGWKIQKPRGLSAKLMTHMNSAIRTPHVIFAVDFEIP
jgi:hypothetical protein